MKTMHALTLPLLLILISCVLCEESVCDENGNCHVGPTQKQIAIVGGGIAGSSTAYYLYQLVPEAKITVYEKDDQVCGRVTDTIINGRTVEVGGSIYHESNTNVDGFVKQFNLTKLTPFGGSTVGIWNGKEFVFLPSGIPVLGEVVDIVKMFYRYGMSPYNLKTYLNGLMSNWSKLYDFEEPFGTVDEFFQRLGLQDAATSLAPDHLEKFGISREFTKEVLGSMTRVNYNTDVNIMNAFGVAVSAIGSGNNVHSVAGGNKQICTNLVASAKAKSHFGHKVTAITRDTSGKYTVETEKDKTSFDAVVIATPLELASIKFNNVDVDEFVFHAREYQVVHVTFVAGTVNPTYFNMKDGPAPSFILTIEEASIPFSSIGRSKNITLEDGRPVSKVFSRAALSEDMLSKIFINGTVVFKKIIPAYPILKPPQKFVPIQLADQLYYVNSMESVISTIETETISAKNIARLVAKSWGQPHTKKL